MKAKLLKEQMGVPAGTEMEVLETGRAWTLKAPSGAEIVVPSCDVEMVPGQQTVAFVDPAFTEPSVTFAEVDPKDPSLLVNIFGGQPQPVESEGPIDPETDPAVRDEDGNVVMNDPEPTGEEEEGQFVESVFPSDEEPVHEFGSEPAADFDRTLADDDLDEPLPTPQGNCDGEGCESCQ